MVKKAVPAKKPAGAAKKQSRERKSRTRQTRGGESGRASNDDHAEADRGSTR